MTVCVKCHVYFLTFVFANESWFFVCSFKFHFLLVWRPIKRPQLTLRHRHARFDWSHDHLRWTICTWWRVHWSDKSRFLLRPTGGRARVWRQRNTSFQDNHILGTTAFGSGGVTVWGYFSFDCKLDLYVLDGNLTGQCSWTTTLGHIEPELYMFYSKRLFRQFHGLRCRQTWTL
jgi:hypothetical protein